MRVDIPPTLRGTPGEQIAMLSRYLYRLAEALNTEASAPQAQTAAISQAPQRSGNTEEYAELRSLIVNTADTVTAYADRLVQGLSSVYVAKSEFGTFTENISSTIESTARGVVESYDYDEAIEALDALAGENRQYITTLNGEIRRGILVDPETGLPELGIAISENLSFTGETVTEGGLVYYRIAPGQTFGLYTATGWQFWVNGAKAGWFSSEDGMLHVTNIVTENSFSLGADWAFSTAGGFGIRYTG